MRTQIDRILRRLGLARIAVRAPETPARFPDIPKSDLDNLRVFDGFTMTSIERRYALKNAVRHISRVKLKGAVVECGVWRGGSSMLMMSELLSQNDLRDIYLYDTFCGMPEPGSIDIDHSGRSAKDRLQEEQNIRESSHVWAIASIGDVRRNIGSIGYPQDKTFLVEGMVEETIPRVVPSEIALLRLDTDWYASTRHELEHLYPRLMSGGVLIIDDYGYWGGARTAVDEFFNALENPPLLNRIDETGRIAVKP